ncbi:MAG: hypothetical protein KIT31_38490, partial [Deltaproteobacteria bacterium]|nr:hypothetical protein [Deltaproteobacteria bacterium]
PVAVIDLSGDESTTKLARDLNRTLLSHRALEPLLEEAGAELVGAYTGEDAAKIEVAQIQYRRALANAQRAAVISDARTGEESLHGAVPTSAVTALYADLAFVAGVAHLGDRDPARAAAAFVLSDRLVPGRVLDDSTTTPDVIAAFEAARAAGATVPKVTVVVKGSGRVWIDGREVGMPGPFELAAGPHVVWLTGPERNTEAQQITVAPGQPSSVAFEENPAQLRTKLRRARTALAGAVDAAARAAAMKALARLVKVEDAVLISSANDKVIVQTWRDQAPGFSALSEYKNEPAIALLEVLAPSPRIVERPPPPWQPPIETPWYRKRNVRLGTLATLVVIAGIVLATSFEGSVRNEDTPKWLRR